MTESQRLDYLYLGLQHLAEAGGQATEVPVSLLNLSLETPLELVAEDLLLVGKVDDTLLHPGELGRQELLELCTVGIYQRIGPEEHINIMN